MSETLHPPLPTPDQRSIDQFGSLTSAAAALAYAGALPLLIGALLIGARPIDWGPTILPLMTNYAVALLAFFGGVRWGVAVMAQGGPSFRALLGAIVPMLLAVVLLSATDMVRLGVLVIAIPLLLMDDLRATRKGSGAPAWYLAVRVPLTVMMETALLATLLIVSLRSEI